MLSSFGAIGGMDLALMVRYLEGLEKVRQLGNKRPSVHHVVEQMVHGDMKIVKDIFVRSPHLPAFLHKLSKAEVQYWMNIRETLIGDSVVGRRDCLPLRGSQLEAYKTLSSANRVEYWKVMRCVDIFEPFMHLPKMKEAIHGVVISFSTIVKNFDRYVKAKVANKENKLSVFGETCFENLPEGLEPCKC